MSMNSETSAVLNIGTLLGLGLLAVGLLLTSFEISKTILSVGALILICTPMAGLLVSTKCLIMEKDRFWTKIALILIAIIVAGLVLAALV